LKSEIRITRILVIEDNPADVQLLRYLFELDPEWNTEFVVVEDGEEAINYLLNRDTPKPDLVILDLNLPKRDGIDVLRTIRDSDRLHGLRVAVFSSFPETAIKAKIGDASLKADAYIHKPMGFSELPGLVGRFHRCCESPTPTSQGSARA
jgi:two-component system, chemotaxis family, response regulator Rcp1